jgi:hypothetical protein
MTGKWEKSSLEMLITVAPRAGIRVTLKTAVQESSRARPPIVEAGRRRPFLCIYSLITNQALSPESPI